MDHTPPLSEGRHRDTAWEACAHFPRAHHMPLPFADLAKPLSAVGVFAGG